ncbi:hypothetical protein A4X13_0g8439 [Tilletia indica]|uniref:Uncharacterized protein n=1 Tax=Tilletia indica TaxID=43049 RepID=A0A8T8SFN5_9BASI|nr:hypothetical protein A4X13_0g8439 [Tilletia indica]
MMLTESAAAHQTSVSTSPFVASELHPSSSAHFAPPVSPTALRLPDPHNTVSTMLLIQVEYNDATKTITAEEVSGMLVLRMRETVEAHLNGFVKDVVVFFPPCILPLPPPFQDSRAQRHRHRRSWPP